MSTPVLAAGTVMTATGVPAHRAGAASPEPHQRPLMDRIDIHLDVQRVPYQKLEAAGTGEPSTVIRARIEASRKVQAERVAPRR